MSEIHIYDIIRRPIITEKTDYQSEALNQYSFEVDKRATKQQIKEAVEVVFDVDVEKVRTAIMPAKRGRRLRKTIIRKKEWKKAIVTLSAGQSIDLFDV
jgi:large subunit ribosomal protein L23